MPRPPSVTDLLSARVLRLSNTLGLYASRRYRDEFDIRLPEWRVLSIIAACEPTTAKEVSRILATDKAWVGLSVASLQRSGYVTRSSDDQDARRRPVSLTRKGRAMHDAILAVARRRQRRLLASLPQDAAKILITSLDCLQAEADKMLSELSSTPVPRANPKIRTRQRAG